MTESKIDATDRLKREGRWEEASLFKDEKIRELRTTGLKRPEAQSKAWASMEMQFPPIEIRQEEEPDQDQALEFSDDQIASLPSGNLEGFYADVGWCYGNLERGEVDPATAPSSGALALLKWARQNRSDFFSRIVPRAMAAPNPRREEEAAADAEHRRIRRLEDVLGVQKPEPRKD